MAQALYSRNNAEIQGVARVVGKGANASFTQDDLIVALREDVFCSHQKLLERRGHPALQENRLACTAGTPQQREILHIARSDLHTVCVSFDKIEGLNINSFCDDAEPGLFPHFSQ